MTSRRLSPIVALALLWPTLAGAQVGQGYTPPVPPPAIYAAGVTGNSLVGTLPANGVVTSYVLRETAGHSVTVTIGTTSGGSQVVTSQVVPASGTLTIPVGSMSENWFSATATQALYLNSASWGSASLNVTANYQMGP